MARYPDAETAPPPLGDKVTDDPMWHFGYPSKEGYAHLRIWTIPGTKHGRLAVVAHKIGPRHVTMAIEEIWEALQGMYGPSLVLLQHWPPTNPAIPEHLDLVKILPGHRIAQFFRIWPTLKDSPRRHALQAWMTAYGHQIVTGPLDVYDH